MAGISCDGGRSQCNRLAGRIASAEDNDETAGLPFSPQYVRARGWATIGGKCRNCRRVCRGAGSKFNQNQSNAAAADGSLGELLQ